MWLIFKELQGNIYFVFVYCAMHSLYTGFALMYLNMQQMNNMTN